MTGRLLKRAKKVLTRGGTSRGESNGTTQTSSTPFHPESPDDHESSGTAQPSRHSFHSSSQHVPHSDNGVWLIGRQ